MKIKNIKIRDIAGEKVIVMQGKYGVDMTKVVSLNSSSEYLITELQNKNFELNDVVNLLLAKYDVADDVARNDAAVWVDKLVGCGIIEK